MLETRDVHQYYGSSHTLRGTSLTVPEGTCTVVMGRNGVGKTTLLRAIMGLVPLRSGSVKFGDRELVGVNASERARVGIGYVPQGREIFAQLTVEENLRVGVFARSDGKAEIPELVFRLFPVLKTMMHRRGGDLSGRPTATARDRARAHDRTQVRPSRRADRRNPAEHRARDRRT